MWCPKCKTEYIDGITKCADCGVDLVEELPATSYDDLSGETREKLSHIKAVEESKSTLNPKEGSTRYIDKRSQYEEMKSSAYTPKHALKCMDYSVTSLLSAIVDALCASCQFMCKYPFFSSK